MTPRDSADKIRRRPSRAACSAASCAMLRRTQTMAPRQVTSKIYTRRCSGELTKCEWQHCLCYEGCTLPRGDGPTSFKLGRRGASSSVGRSWQFWRPAGRRFNLGGLRRLLRQPVPRQLAALGVQSGPVAPQRLRPQVLPAGNAHPGRGPRHPLRVKPLNRLHWPPTRTPIQTRAGWQKNADCTLAQRLSGLQARAMRLQEQSWRVAHPAATR